MGMRYLCVICAYNSLGNYEIMAHNSLLNTHKWDLSNLIETVSVSRLSNLSYLVKVRIPKIILIIHT